MKKYFFLLPLLSLFSCGGSDDVIDDSKPQSYHVIVQDELIGIGQYITLSFDYVSDNPNIAVTWFEEDERLNSIPRSTNTYTWQPTNEGLRTIKAVITDRNEIITCTAKIQVNKCDLAHGFINDTKAKIMKCYSNAQDDGKCIDFGSYHPNFEEWINQKYYYSGNKITRIEMIGYKMKVSEWGGIHEFHSTRALSYASAYTELAKIYGDAYKGVTSVPQGKGPKGDSYDTDELFNFSVENVTMKSTFKGPNGKDIQMFLTDGTGTYDWFRPIVYVGDATQGLGSYY